MATHTTVTTEITDYLYLLWGWVTDLRGNQGGGSRCSSDQAWEGRGNLRSEDVCLDPGTPHWGCRSASRRCRSRASSRIAGAPSDS